LQAQRYQRQRRMQTYSSAFFYAFAACAVGGAGQLAYV